MTISSSQLEKTKIRKVILVADDESAIHNSVREILDDEGYEVLMAADGNEALLLSNAHKGNIDLLLTDVEMPCVDGVTASKRFLCDRPNAKVLFISGGTTLLGLSRQLHFLRKPFSLDELLAKVDEILQDSAITPDTSAESIMIRRGALTAKA
jgi:two-component system cell cycle sensor histidine kinase/response regulator CckA